MAISGRQRERLSTQNATKRRKMGDNRLCTIFSDCRNGWTLYRKMCYTASVKKTTGDKARVECEAMQAVLASVHDEHMATFIVNLTNG